MEPRRAPDYTRPYGVGGIEWAWLYNQPTVPLRGQHGLLARLMIAEVADMNMLQAIMLRWGEKKSMRTHVDWMSVRWVKDVLKSLDEDEGCLGRRMESFDGIEAEVCTFQANHFYLMVQSGSQDLFWWQKQSLPPPAPLVHFENVLRA